MKFPLIDKQCIDWAIHFPLDSQIKAKKKFIKIKPTSYAEEPKS